MSSTKRVIPWILGAVLGATLTVVAVYTFTRQANRLVSPSPITNGRGDQGQHYGSKSTCGYNVCPQLNPNMLNVHLVAHTHDDVGWLKTVDQYFYNEKQRIQKAGVEQIIDSVVHSLLRDPKRRFIYAEGVFFFKWWHKQSPQLQDQVKQLVAEGRLEIIGGGWSMNDEATTNYQSIIDQMTWGLKNFNDTFNECGRPSVGWQIDPFGHSRTMASLFAQMGYDGVFFVRIDYQDKDIRLDNQTAELVWHGSPNLGASSDIFTSVLFNWYTSPDGFCFDVLCEDEPIIDDKSSTEYNVDRRLNAFEKYIVKAAKQMRTKNVLLPMGGDFTFMQAEMQFKNIDLLIKYGNDRQLNGSNINYLYSTPACYLKALHDTNTEWPTKDDDFFPYASDSHTYWNGYFTSRPTLKRFERMGNNFLQVCKQLSIEADRIPLSPAISSNLDTLRDVMGIMQHHDAIAGTEMQHVANDYAYLLNNGIERCEENTREILNHLVGDKQQQVKGSSRAPPIQLDFNNCLELNISSCVVSESSDNFQVTLYNPLEHVVQRVVRVPVATPDYVVKDHDGLAVGVQVVPVPREVLALHYRISPAQYEIVFLADSIPALGYRSYYVSKQKTVEEAKVQGEADASLPLMLRNDFLELKFDENGLLSHVTTEDGQQQKLAQSFHYYYSAAGNNRVAENRSSGAYIFRPNGTINSFTRADVRVIKGDLVQEVHQKFNDWISQVIRVYKNSRHIEFEWLVGPIPVDDKQGREIVTRFDTDIQSNGLFYTDSNGREMLQRRRNYRDTWQLNVNESVAANYFPITAKIAMEDNTSRIAVLSDRSQGGGSLADGSIEMMVHRRTLHDDDFGVMEPLNETAYGKGLIARGTHYLLFNTKKPEQWRFSHAAERYLQLHEQLQPWMFFSDLKNMPVDVWQSTYRNTKSAMAASLPPQVHLLTFEPWRKNTLLLRFEHIFETLEDDNHSKPVTFNVKDVFGGFVITEMRETMLAANRWRDESSRLQFKANITRDASLEMKKLPDAQPNADNDYTITLEPMQIRTFIVTVNWKP